MNRSVGRRSFLLMAAVAGANARPGNKQPETVYLFSTPECEGRMSVTFYNAYASREFNFRERLTNNRFCLSGKGQENKDCLQDFSGSVAIALYHLRARQDGVKSLKLRELVRTIDQDARVAPRPQYERSLEPEGGIVSDIQAFGVSKESSADARAQIAAKRGPWCLMRQDLYLDGHSAPFLIVHWKHSLAAITLLDVIPGDTTELVLNSSGKG